jgi:hypothetical protein
VTSIQVLTDVTPVRLVNSYRRFGRGVLPSSPGSETSVAVYQWTRRHIPQNLNLPEHRCENAKCNTGITKTLNRWPRGLRLGLLAARFVGLRVRIPPGAWTSVSCKCSVLSGRGLCAGLITPPEKSYPVCCVWVWSWSLNNEEAMAHQGLSSHAKINHQNGDYFKILGGSLWTSDLWKMSLASHHELVRHISVHSAVSTKRRTCFRIPTGTLVASKTNCNKRPDRKSSSVNRWQ